MPGLSSTKLAQTICDSGFQTLDDFAKVISDYFNDNCVLGYGWVAVNPKGDPDPTVVQQFTCQSDPCPFTLVKALKSNKLLTAALANEALAKDLTLWLTTITFKPKNSSLNVNAPLLIANVECSPSGAGDQMEAMIALCDQIFNGIEGATPIAGKNSAFIGGGAFAEFIGGKETS